MEYSDNMDEHLSFDEWKRLITSADDCDRYDAANQIPKGPRKEIVRLLIKCLDDTDALVRLSAGETLSWLPGKAALKALRAAVDREQDDLARAYALSSLGAIGTLDDIGRLAEALRTATNPQVRLHAALGIGLCALSVSMEHLHNNLKQDDVIRCTSASALGHYLDNHRAYFKAIRNTVKRQLRREDLMVGDKEPLDNLLAEIEETYKF